MRVLYIQTLFIFFINDVKNINLSQHKYATESYVCFLCLNTLSPLKILLQKLRISQ